MAEELLQLGSVFEDGGEDGPEVDVGFVPAGQ